jgi:hypothetical protein
MGINTLVSLSLGLVFAAITSSTSYKLNSYSVDSGSTNSASSTTYKLNATSGDTEGSASSSATLKAKSGAIEAIQANVPTAPTLSTNSGAYYNKINFVVNTASNPTDATYSIAVSTTSNFTVTNYVQADGTLNTTAVYQTYSVWGSGVGTLVVGLTPNTSYWFKVNAIQGRFTASSYGPSATIATGTPNLSFSVTPTTLNLGSLLAGSIVTSSTISFTYATNAYNGGSIYTSGSDTGLKSPSSSNYIIQVTPPSGNLAALAEGFGLQALTASSPLALVAPYNGTSNVVGAIYTTFQPVYTASTPVTTGTATAVLKAKTSVSTPNATDYTDTLTFVAAASF